VPQTKVTLLIRAENTDTNSALETDQDPYEIFIILVYTLFYSPTVRISTVKHPVFRVHFFKFLSKATNSALETDQDPYEIFIILVYKFYFILPQFESRP
jgi:DNA topoisomerase VI subunit A